METNFCLRVDIDTWEGLRIGVPKCLELSKRNLLPITYYLSLGKYATGRNLFRIIGNKESIKREIPVWERNHWKDLVRGVLIPPRKIGKSMIEQLQEYEKNQYSEFHPHGYNHVRWTSRFSQFSKNETSEYLDLVGTEYRKIFNKKPIANAAPSFEVNPFYFSMLQEKQFKFAADFIYESPFVLQTNENEGSIVQLPVTEISIEDLMIEGKNKADIVEFYSKRFQELVDRGCFYICLYAHAIFEPVRMYSVIEEIVKITERLDMKPVTHSEYYSQIKDIPTKKTKEILQEMQK